MPEHFLVCGMGEVGHRVVSLLRRLGEPVIVISLEARSDWIRSARADGVTVLLGDARDEVLLDEAGIGSAQALIAATDQDPVNIEIGLYAGQVRPELPVVLRLFDQGLAQEIEDRFHARRALSMSALAAPRFAAAAMGEEIVALFTVDDTVFLVRRTVVDGAGLLASSSVQAVSDRHRLVTLANESSAGAVALAPHPHIILQAGDRATLAGRASDWDGFEGGGSGGAQPDSGPAWQRPLAHIPQRSVLLRRIVQAWHTAPAAMRAVFLTLASLIGLSVFVFGLAMNLSLVDAIYFVITTVTTTGYGDITPRNASDALKLYAALIMVLGSLTFAALFSIITDLIVTARFRQLLEGRAVPHEGHIVVVGLGNVGYRIVGELHRMGARIVAVERDPNGEFVEGVRARTPLVIGDARLGDTLAKAGVERASALVAATHDDAVNLGVGLAAKQMNGRIRNVVRLFDADFAVKVRGTLPVDAVLSGSMIAAPTFVAAALYPDVLTAFLMDGYLVAILRRAAGHEWAGATPVELRVARDVGLLFRRRPGDKTYSASDWSAPVLAEEEVIAAVWRPLVS